MYAPHAIPQSLQSFLGFGTPWLSARVLERARSCAHVCAERREAWHACFCCSTCCVASLMRPLDRDWPGGNGVVPRSSAEIHVNILVHAERGAGEVDLVDVDAAWDAVATIESESRSQQPAL